MRLGIFCSSKPALALIFRESTREIVSRLEASGLISSFVYGGGIDGLMGLIREFATLPVTGHNLPRWNPLPDENVYSSLRERQAALIDDADAYLVLAGGVGTLYELFQVLCENDVEKKRKPVVIYDPDRVYSPLQDLFQRMFDQKYVSLPPRVEFCDTTEKVITFLSQIVQEKTLGS